MGSKNLKAIVIKGSGKPPLYDQKRFAYLRSTLNQDLRNNSSSIVLRELGTSSATEFFDYLSEQPKKYFQRCSFDNDLNVTGTRMKETILTGISACHACVIACGRTIESDHNNETPMRKRKGPEYETMMGFGPNLWINDLDFTVRMGEICDRFGVDSISLSNTLGLAFRLYEIGAITKKDTDNVELEWGNTLAVETLISLTIQGKGIGAIISKGAKELARNFGYPEEAVQVNGLEAPFHDPRGVTGMALVYATSPRGACHNQSDYFMADIGQVEKSLNMKIFSRLDGYEKTPNVIIHQNWRSVFNSLVLCFFANLPPESIVEMVNSVTGLNLNLKDLLVIGDRAWTLKRVINFRLGLTKNNDKLPKSFMIPFHDDMELSNSTVPDIKQMLEHYYRLRKWEQESGFPSSELLQELNLDWVSD